MHAEASPPTLLWADRDHQRPYGQAIDPVYLAAIDKGQSVNVVDGGPCVSVNESLIDSRAVNGL